MIPTGPAPARNAPALAIPGFTPSATGTVNDRTGGKGCLRVLPGRSRPGRGYQAQTLVPDREVKEKVNTAPA